MPAPPADTTPSSFKPPPPQSVTVPGPCGALEARLVNPLPEGAAAPAVCVVCHPHPLHGGTMQNKVVHTAARAVQEAGAPTLRFNFRGVEASEGSYDAGVGEVDDALAAVAWMRQRFQCETLWLAGFSFGAAVALQAAVRGAVPAKLVTIAPPVGRIITDPIPRPDSDWLIVQGDHDELVDAQLVRQWAAGYEPPPRLLVIEGAEHFFHGKLLELRTGILRFVRGQDPGRA
ncbi:MAG: alpha/beta hydrolase [Steroidobacteraceae bacterium]